MLLVIFEAAMCRCDPRDISKKKTTSVELNSVHANECQIGCEGEETGWGGGTNGGEEGRVGRKIFSIEWYSALNHRRGEHPGSVRTDSSLEKMMLVSAQSGISIRMCLC